MEPQRIRADYDSLKQIALQLAEQAAATQAALNTLEAAKSSLQPNDWTGPKAAEFHDEMDSQVLPAMQLLVAALEHSAQAMDQLLLVIQQATAEAGRLAEQSGGTVPPSIVAAGAVGAAIAMAGEALTGQLSQAQSAEAEATPPTADDDGESGSWQDWSIDDFVDPAT